MIDFVIKLIICILVLILIDIYMPKRISKFEIYATALLAIVLTLSNGIFFDLKYDLYGYGLKGIDFWGYIAEITLNPLGCIIIVNFYPFNTKTKIKVLYIILASIGVTAFEALCLSLQFYYYNGWKLYYSVFYYPILIYMQILNVYLIRKLLRASE